MEHQFIGTPARIVHVDPTGRVAYFAFKNGNTGRITSEEEMALVTDQIVLINDYSWEAAPDAVWGEAISPAISPREPTSVGVVRKVLDGEIVLETALGLNIIAHDGSIEVKRGNTVELSETAGVVRILADMPLRIRDDDTDRDDIDRFIVPSSASGPTFDDFGGYPNVVARARELIETQLDNKSYLDAIGARPIKGIIFTGLPGTGKTLLARIIAAESGAKFFVVNGPAIVSKWVGDSEDTLRRIFDAAEGEERAIIFFDEIDSIAEQRNDDSHEASKRLVAQLLTSMDGFDKSKGNVVVIAATNRVDDLDVALRRPGRFDWEIEFGMPTASDRLAILHASQRPLSTSGVLPLETIAELSDGWSAARLASIWTEASLVTAADKRSAISGEDLAEAFERVSLRHTKANDS